MQFDTGGAVEYKCLMPGFPSDKILYSYSNICGLSVWYMRHVTFLASRILRGAPRFWKICEHLRKKYHEHANPLCSMWCSYMLVNSYA
jgi:hypothetical protein